MNRRILLIGPSASGKSTVAEILARELRVPVVPMDAFRCKRMLFVTHEGRQVRNFEDPRMWDDNALACKLRALINSNQGFVAEGLHLLRYPAIAAIPQTERWYLDIPHELALARRKTRHRNLPSDESFAIIGREQTRIHVEPQKDIPDVRVIDGTMPVADVVGAILGVEVAR